MRREWRISRGGFEEHGSGPKVEIRQSRICSRIGYPSCFGSFLPGTRVDARGLLILPRSMRQGFGAVLSYPRPRAFYK